MSGAFWALDLLTLAEIEAIFAAEQKPIAARHADRGGAVPGYVRRPAMYVAKKA